MPSWTNPRDWANGDVPDGAMLNTHLRDDLKYLKGLFDGSETQSWNPRHASNDANGIGVTFGKARGTLAAPTIVQNGDVLAYLGFAGYDGVAYRTAVQFRPFVNGTPGASDMPGGLGIWLVPDTGSITPVERVRINAAGELLANLLGALSGNLMSTSDAALALTSNTYAGAALTVNQGVNEDALLVNSYGGDQVFVNSHGSLVGTRYLSFQNIALGDVTGMDDPSAGGFGGTSNGILRWSNAIGPSTNPPGGFGLTWYDDAVGALKLRTDTGVVRQMLNAGCRAYHNTNQSIANNTLTAMALNSERHDTDGFHDGATNNTRLTVPSGMGGKYAISGSLEWAANADTAERLIAIRLNGATLLAADSRAAMSSIAVRQSVTTIYELAAGDYVELIGRQQSGGALNVIMTGNYSPEFEIAAVG